MSMISFLSLYKAFEEQFLIFEKSAARALDELQTTIKTIKNRTVPSTEDTNKLYNLLKSLQDSYNDTYKTACTILGNDLKSKHGSQLDKINKIISDKMLKAEDLFHNSKVILMEFLAVKADYKPHMEALIPFYNKAQEIIKEIQENRIAIEQLELDITPYSLFLEALNLNTCDTEKKELLYGEIDRFFPACVSRALYSGKYFCAANNKYSSEDSDSDNAIRNIPHMQEISKSISNTTEKHKEHQHTRIDNTTNSFSNKNLTQASSHISVATHDAIGSDVDPAPGTNEGDCLNANDVTCYIDIPRLSGSGHAKFVTSILKNEYITLFQLFASFGILTQSQVIDFGILAGKFNHRNKAKAQSALQFLITKGYLARITKPIVALAMPSYHVEIVRPVYSRHKMDVQALFKGERQCKNQVLESFIKNAATQNERILSYLKGVKEFTSDKFKTILDSVVIHENNIQIDILWKELLITCWLVIDFNELNVMPGAWLLIPDETQGLPELIDMPEEAVFYTFQNGQIYHWNNGWNDEHGNRLQSPATLGTCQAVQSTVSVNGEDGQRCHAELQSKSTPVEKNEAREDGEIVNVDPVAAHAAIDSEFKTDILLMDDCNDKSDKNDTYTMDEEILQNETIAQTAGRLASRPSMPSDKEFKHIISRLLTYCSALDTEKKLNSRVAQALMLSKTAELQGRSACATLYMQLLLATGTVFEAADFAGYNLNACFSGSAHSQSLTLSAYMHALFAPFNERDYALQEQAEMYQRDYDKNFPDYPDIKPLFTELCRIHSIDPRGFNTAVLSQMENEEEKKSTMRVLQQRAQKCMGEPNIKSYLHGIPEMISSCFGNKSELHTCIEIVARNVQRDKDIVEDVFLEYGERQGDLYTIIDKYIENIIDSKWASASKKQSTQRLTLGNMARKQIRDAFVERLDIMKEWMESASHMDSGRLDKLHMLKNSILRELNKLPDFYDNCVGSDYSGVVIYMLSYLRRRLERRSGGQYLFADALRTGFVELDDRFLPILDKEMCAVRYYEPWRRVLKHIASPEMTIELAEKEISDTPDSPMFDNLHQLELIAKLQGREEYSRSVVDKAKKRAKEKTDVFMGNLELAYAAGRITEQDKEDLLQLILVYQDDFFSTNNFGCWRQFIEALTKQKIDKVTKNRDALNNELALRRVSGVSSPILTIAERHLADEQFAIAEEYINIFDSGDKEHSDDLKAVLNEDDSFSHFLSPDVFDPLYDYCMRSLKGKALSIAGPFFLKDRFPSDWTARHKDDSTKFIQNWPSSRSNKLPQEIRALVEALGVEVSASTKMSNKSIDMFDLRVKPTPCNYTDYTHPIAAFGTQLKSPLVVVVLYGSHQPKELVDTINTLNPNRNGMTIVLLDYALSLNSRCQLAEHCHQSSGLTPFIVIDRVLALHLALHQRTERMSELLKCSLPYATAVQPFVRDGGPTADEMFCGRTKELADILDPKGAIVVYGGRQLGKTALLQRAQSRFNSPTNKCFAVFCSIKDKSNEKDLVEFLVAEVNKGTKLNISPCTTVRAFCEQLDLLFNDGQIQSMLLLLDETDDFLRSIASSGYAQVQALIDLKRSRESFKFVLAGLNNVYRARNATRHNGVFGQLGQPLCIKPFSPAEALRLILRPLRYLGFQPGQDNQFEIILSSTNYYPGILQFFGYTLVQSLNERYTRYYRASEGNPPLILKSDHIGAIMNSDALNDSIKDKFRLSLKLDDRYYMLARCIGMLYHYQAAMIDSYRGYAVQQIREMANDYSIECLAGLADDECETLLDEMTEMGILHRSKPGVYRLRKRSFLDIIGSDMDRLDAEIRDENNKGFE